jgi:site-specific recombinase XerC
MDKITNSANLDHFTFHALRHTFSTRMLEAGVPAKVVQEILGHADVTLTLNTYSHVLETTAHEQIAKINAIFAENVEKSAPESVLKRIAESREPGKETAKEKKQAGKNKKKSNHEL